MSSEKSPLVVAKSNNGNGIFTMRAFQIGETLFRVTGSFVSGDIDDDMDDRTRANTYRYDSDRYISPDGSIGDFLNHSCEPNAKVVKAKGRLFVVAHIRIPKGREVLIDYSTITACDDEWTMRCRCGTPSCRKMVRAFHTLPRELQNSYITDGVVPRYILRINRELET